MTRRTATIYPTTYIVRIAACLAMLALCVLRTSAQVTGGDAAPPPPPRSSRPVLVGVEFEGNEDNDLNDKVLKAQIKSKPTDRPALRVFSIFARVYDLNPVMPQYMRDEMHSIVDSLAGDVRFLNPRLLQEDTMELRKIYNQFGYPEVQLDYRMLIDTARNRSKIRYFIDEGPRYKNHGIHYVGIEEVPKEVFDKFREPVAFDIGDDYRTDEVILESGRAVVTLQNEGYPFVTRTDIITIQRHDSLRDLRYDSTLVAIYTGDRYRFGSTTYVPDTQHEGTPLKEWVVMRQLEYNPGEWYSREKVDQTVSNLYGLGVFEYVRLDSLQSRSTEDTLAMQIVTKLLDPRTVTVTPELSFERYINDYYAFVGGSVTYSHANLFGGAEKGTIQGRIRTPLNDFGNLLTYGASLSFLNPSLFSRRMALQITGGYDHAVEDRVIEELRLTAESEPEEFTFPLISDRFFGTTELTYRFPRYTWFSSLTGRIAAQHLKYSEVRPYIEKKAALRVLDAINREIVDPGVRDEATAQVYDAMVNSIFREQIWLGDDPSLVTNPYVRDAFDELKWSIIGSVSSTADKRDDPFGPRNGYFVDGRFEFGTNLFVNQWGKVELDYRHYLPWDDDKTIAGRGHIGVIVPFGPIKLVPLTSRFWSGGANSLRGWGPREMLVTSPPPGLDSNIIGRAIVDEVLRDGRRLLGGLFVMEAMADWRWKPFHFPATSTLMQQINQLGMIFGLDAGGGFFRDYEDDGVTLGNFLEKIVDGIGISPSIAIAYDTPIGPLRLGTGWALRDPVLYPDEPWAWQRPVKFRDLAWFFSIGHAF